MNTSRDADKFSSEIRAKLNKYGSKTFVNEEGQMTCGFIEHIKEQSREKLFKKEKYDEQKTCNVCGLTKELDDFHFQRWCKSKVSNTCKVCKNTQRRKDHETKMKAEGKTYKKRKPKYIKQKVSN